MADSNSPAETRLNTSLKEPDDEGRVRVWAPWATHVQLHHADRKASSREVGLIRKVDLQQVREGWWSSGPCLQSGDDYGFSIDGGPVLPDPASRWQPAGVHAMSCWFDPGSLRWNDIDWGGLDVRDSIIYELHVGTFTKQGTLDSAIERLDYLESLGITLVELMPVASFAGEHGWGYDGVALYSVHEPYGGPQALQRFVDAAHSRALGVCLDVVYNHLGPSGNYLGQYGPYFSRRHKTPWGDAINLDEAGSEHVRRFIIENALYWFEHFHIDALRLDAVHALVDDSPTHLLAELAGQVRQLSRELGRPLSLIAESDLNDPLMVTGLECGGRGMDAQWADDVHHAVHTVLTGETQGYYVDFGSLDILVRALTQGFVYQGDYSTFRKRPWGKPLPVDFDLRRFVVFGASHDQVGNRAYGDRPGKSLSSAELAIGASMILCSPMTPMIFMGEEWGAKTPWLYFSDHQEPELALAVREGRRREFFTQVEQSLYSASLDDIPDPQSRDTFIQSKLDWTEMLQEPHQSLCAWYRRLIALRRSRPSAWNVEAGITLSIVRDDHDQWLVIDRGNFLLCITWPDADVSRSITVPLRKLSCEGCRPATMKKVEPSTASGCRYAVLLAWHPHETRVTQDQHLQIPVGSVAVIDVQAR